MCTYYIFSHYYIFSAYYILVIVLRGMAKLKYSKTVKREAIVELKMRLINLVKVLRFG